MDQTAGLAVTRAVGTDDDQLRTELHRFVERHRRAHPERPSLVRRAHDDCAARPSRHRHRHSAQLWIVALVHRRVEGVDVDVEDGPWPVVRSRHACGQSATTTCGLLPFGAPGLAVKTWRGRGGRVQPGRKLCLLTSLTWQGEGFWKESILIPEWAQPRRRSRPGDEGKPSGFSLIS